MELQRGTMRSLPFLVFSKWIYPSSICTCLFLMDNASDIRIPVLYKRRSRAGIDMSAVPIRMSYNRYSSAAVNMAAICSWVKMYGVKSDLGCFGKRGIKHVHPHLHISVVS